MSHTTHFDDCGCQSAALRKRIAELEQREREFDKLHAVQVARVEILIGEKATLEAELAFLRDLPVDALKKQLEEMEEMSALNVRLGDILTLTVNALRGEPDSRSLHDWATLPEVARKIVAEQSRLAGSVTYWKGMWERFAQDSLTWQAHAATLRDALEQCDCETLTNGMGEYEGHDPKCVRCTALASTPAQSLAALKAEVLERAAEACDSVADEAPVEIGPGLHAPHPIALRCGIRIRALAAQAATHSELEVKP